MYYTPSSIIQTPKIVWENASTHKKYAPLVWLINPYKLYLSNFITASVPYSY